MPQAPLISRPGIEAFWRFAHGPLQLGIGNGWGDGDRYRFGDLVLYRQVLNRGRRMISLICCPLCRLDHHWLWLAARCSEFEQIVDGTDQRPFMEHRRQTAPQKLAKAARLLDLPEHRLDHLLAQPV